MNNILAWCLCWSIILTTALVHAAPDPRILEARTRFAGAERQFALGDFAGALKGYRRAYEAKPLPGFLFNMAQCHRHLGNYPKALFLFKQYLLRSPDAKNRKVVERLITLCQTSLDRGAQPASKTPPVRPAGARQARSEISPRPAVKDTRQDAKNDAGPSTVWFWSGVGLTSALLIAGTVTGALALSQSDTYMDPGTSLVRRHELKDSGSSLATASTALFGIAAAAAAGTAVVFYFTRFSSRETPAVMTASPLDGGAALVVGGTF